MRLIVAFVALGACVSAQADTKASHVEQASETVSVEMYGDPCPSPTCDVGTGGVLVKYKAGAVQRQWKVPDYNTAEGDYADGRVGFVVDDPLGKFILAFVWTGGNHCCWPVLIFSVKSGKFVDRQ